MELFLARRGFMKNKKQLVFSGVTAVLLATNGILGYNYHQDTKSLEKQIDQYRQHNNELTLQYIDLSSYLEKQQGTVDKQKDKINKLEKLNKYFVLKNEEIKLENKKLKVNIMKNEQKVEKMSKNQQKNSNKTVVLTGGKNKGQTYSVTAFTSGFESTQKKKGQSGYGITASGARVKEGITAACPKSMKFGTKVKIEGVGTRVCEDRGSRITNGHLDVYVTNLSTAKKFGRKNLKVEIVN